MGQFHKAIAAVAMAAGMMAASAASAAIYVLDVGTLEKPRTVNIAGLGNVSAAPMQFKASSGGRSFDIVAWCVDVYHQITAKDYAPDLQYQDGSLLTNDFSAAQTPLDDGDLRKVGLLANYGYDVFLDRPVAPAAFTDPRPARASYPNTKAGTTAYNAAVAGWNAAKGAHNAKVTAYNAAVSTRYTRLSAVQSAIWQVVSNRNVTSVTSDAAFDLLVDNLSGDHLTDYFAGGYGPQGQAITLITPVPQFGGKTGKTLLTPTQSFVYAEVPEPATWLMMILGFGGMGAVLRRRRGLALAPVSR